MTLKLSLLKCSIATVACSGVLLTGSLITGKAPVSARDDERAGVTFFTGMCDASAAAPIDAERFVVADDEDNILRIYPREGGLPVAQLDVSAFLGNMGKKKGKEADLEAAAQLGSRTFWITSHGRDSKGKEVRERQRLFATEVRSNNGALQIVPVGKPYVGLLDDLIADPRLGRYHLAEAAQKPPKTEGALNIEGLAETPDGHLLIGFRNPVPEGKALLVPLLNPNEVIEGKRARLGAPMELDLRGLGVRSIEFHGGRWLIIAGSYDGNGTSQLFEWDGKGQPRTVENVSFGGLNPEGIAPGGAGEYFVLSDDGAVLVNGVPAKKLKDPAQKRFRGEVLKL